MEYKVVYTKRILTDIFAGYSNKAKRRLYRLYELRFLRPA